MKYTVLLFCLVLNNALINAQRKFSEFGKADTAELNLKSCSFEPDANAMVLFDVQEVDYEVAAIGDKITTVRRVRIKIFNEKGYHAGTIGIPYYGKKKQNRLRGLKGVIYYYDASGKIVTRSLEEEDFYTDKIRGTVAVKKFTFPELKPGSVLEYTYSIVERDGMQFEPWLLQRDIPVAYVSNSITTPEAAKLTSLVFGTETVKTTAERFKKGGSWDRKLFEKENINSFSAEPYMSSINDNLLRMVFFIRPAYNFVGDFNWNTIVSELQRSPFFGGQIDKKIPATDYIIDSAYRIKDKKERLRYIHQSVRDHFQERTVQTFIPGDLAEAWNDRIGNTTDINLILLNLLKRADIPASWVLINTRENGKVNTDFPTPGQFNGVDVYVKLGETYYLMDASLKFNPVDIPPHNILNRQVYLAAGFAGGWVTVTDSRTLRSESNDIMAWFNDHGLLEGRSTARYYHYAKSIRLDTTVSAATSKAEESTKPIGLKTISTLLEDADNDQLPFTETIEFSFEPNNTGEFYFINPLFLYSKRKNPFVQEKRISEIDFGCNQDNRYGFNLEIPPGYEVEHLPKTITVRAPDSSFLYKRVVTSDGVKIYFSQNLEIKKPIFNKNEYAGIYDFYKNIYGLMEEEIVLKKKK